MTTRTPRRAALCGLLTLSLLALASACGKSAGPQTSTTSNIFGPDERVKLTTLTRPWDALGRLETGCTASLIGKRVAITAAHCVVDADTGAVKQGLGAFELGYTGGHAAAEPWIEYAWIGTQQPETDRVHDWAVLKLDRDAPAGVAPLAIHVVDFAADMPYTISLAGYSEDVDSGSTPALHEGCLILELSEGRLFDDCDSAAGISGAPLIANVSGNPHVVGLAVSEFRRGAPSSVHQDRYTRDYANVGIPAVAFADVARQIVLAVDSGQNPPAFPGVLERTNPNARPDPGPGPNPDPNPNPNPDPGPDPQPHAPTLDDVRTVAQLNANGGALFGQLANVRYRCELIQRNVAGPYQSTAVGTAAGGLLGQAVTGQALATQLQAGLGNAASRQAALDLQLGLSAARATLDHSAAGLPAGGTAALAPLLTDIDAELKAIKGLLLK